MYFVSNVDLPIFNNHNHKRANIFLLLLFIYLFFSFTYFLAIGWMVHPYVVILLQLFSLSNVRYFVSEHIIILSSLGKFYLKPYVMLKRNHLQKTWGPNARTNHGTNHPILFLLLALIMRPRQNYFLKWYECTLPPPPNVCKENPSQLDCPFSVVD